MVVTAAVIGGGATLASAGVASSSGKKASKQASKGDILGRLAAELFKETTPHREITLDRALAALMGETPEEVSPITQARRSSIQREGATGRNRLIDELTRAGLRDSAVGIAGLEDFDRNIASLLSDADLQELVRLMTLGEQIGFGVLDPAISAARGSQGLQLQAGIENARMQSQAGQAAGLAISNLLTTAVRNQPTGTTGTGGTVLPQVNYGGVNPYQTSIANPYDE